jgi:hypothetical protein
MGVRLIAAIVLATSVFLLAQDRAPVEPQRKPDPREPKVMLLEVHDIDHLIVVYARDSRRFVRYLPIGEREAGFRQRLHLTRNIHESDPRRVLVSPAVSEVRLIGSVREGTAQLIFMGEEEELVRYAARWQDGELNWQRVGESHPFFVRAERRKILWDPNYPEESWMKPEDLTREWDDSIWDD